MIPPDVRAVFFDAVGTLIHPEPAAAVVYTAVGQSLGSRLTTAEVAARFRIAFARQEALDLAHGLRTSEERERQRWRHVVAEVLDDVCDPARCFEELFAHFGRPQAWRCDPEAAALLLQLERQSYLLGMASNYDARLHGVAAGMPELRPLRHIVISSEVGWRKPAPQFFGALCARVDLNPAEILFIGDDRGNDYEGATAAGLRAVLVGVGGLRDVIV
ncbi:MAG TPA: HAD-IA family hydrolase [Gemmataceae bacterium]|nr:HAD-IA family hydrolase [Gemmataceae bacterium]